MPDSWAIGAGAVAALAVLVLGLWTFLRKRPGPEEIEQRRRAAINRDGKMGDGQIVDVEPASIVYSYSVGGVVYTASQDVTALREMLPQDMMNTVGSVSVKFDPRNPANSIVLSEGWSGLRTRETHR